MKVLITGASGFVGSHLCELAVRNGCDVHGLELNVKNTDNRGIAGKITLHKCDVRIYKDVLKCIRKIRPSKIFHLAGQPFVPLSWEKPWETFTANVYGQLNIFRAVIELGINPNIQVACSSDEYGIVSKNELPVKETNELRPSSPYATSKVAQDYLAYQFYISHKLKIIRTRAFNHIGPRQRDSFVVSNFAKQIAMIEAKKQETVIRVGNLNAIRDFTDVRDIVRAYWLSVKECKAGEVYNICSGVGHRIENVLNILLRLSKVNPIRELRPLTELAGGDFKPPSACQKGLPPASSMAFSNGVKVKIKQDDERMRLSDIPVLIGDNSKFVRQTGWRPEISFEQTLKDLLDYWRMVIK